MKKILQSLGLALMLVGVPQFVSADENAVPAATEEVVEDANATVQSEEVSQDEQKPEETQEVVEEKAQEK